MLCRDRKVICIVAIHTIISKFVPQKEQTYKFYYNNGTLSAIMIRTLSAILSHIICNYLYIMYSNSHILCKPVAHYMQRKIALSMKYSHIPLSYQLP